MGHRERVVEDRNSGDVHPLDDHVPRSVSTLWICANRTPKCQPTQYRVYKNHSLVTGSIRRIQNVVVVAYLFVTLQRVIYVLYLGALCRAPFEHHKDICMYF